MLDNFELEAMREAVQFIRGRVEVEASGGVNMETVKARPLQKQVSITFPWETDPYHRQPGPQFQGDDLALNPVTIAGRW